MKLINFAILFLLLSLVVYSHEEGVEHNESHALNGFSASNFFEAYPPILVLSFSFLLIVLILLYSNIKMASLSEIEKKWIYRAVVFITVLATLYLVISTILLNLESDTGGPVHWHADYEIWYCGKLLGLEKHSDLEGKTGTNILHHHNDNRIHIEGTVIKKSDVTISKYFENIGGLLQSGKLKVILEDGSIFSVKNGDLCPSGKPGQLKVFVNGKEVKDYPDYVISPYSTVPPGDFIEIVFSEQPESKFYGRGE